MKMRKISALILTAALLLSAIMPAFAETASPAEAASKLVKVNKLPAGDSLTDWYYFLLARTDALPEDCGYLAQLQDYVKTAYKKNGGLDDSRATEWQRIGLTVAALGGDPTCFVKVKQNVDLIADGTYNWSTTESLDFSGINGLIFALIALDSGCYAVPSGARYTRNGILAQLTKAQAPDGGFGSAMGGSDVDMTAMALQALAPYRNDSALYPCSDGEQRTIGKVIEDGLYFLSSHQTAQGDFSNMGSSSCESSAQVVIALCSLGIDPAEDSRFVKKGGSALDGLLRFCLADGSYCHSLEDSEGNFMATVQAGLAMTAYDRLQNGMRRLYDLRPEPSQQVWDQIEVVNTSLEEQVPARALVQQYLSIPQEERSYVMGWDTTVVDENPAEFYDLTQPGTGVFGHGSGIGVGWIVLFAALAAAAAFLLFKRKGVRK